MFGQNKPTSKHYFSDLPENSLGIVSRFYTLQGEGPYSGMPALFIRLSKCNLTCGFCDTYFNDMIIYSFNELYDDGINCIINWREKNSSIDNKDINDHKNWIKNNVGIVITGGEPMLQENIKGFLEYVKDKFAWSQIESNGTIYSDIPEHTTLVCSPKAPKKKYIKPSLKYLNRADCLKFVVSSDENSPYYDIPDWAVEWSLKTKKPIYVSPMNIYKKEPEQSKILRMQNTENDIITRSNVDEVISFWEDGLLDTTQNEKNHNRAGLLCMRYGFKLNLQVHLYASLP